MSACVWAWMMMTFWSKRKLSYLTSLHSIQCSVTQQIICVYKNIYFSFKILCQRLISRCCELNPRSNILLQKKKSIRFINKDIFICIIFSWNCFPQFSKDKQHFPCNLSPLKARPCACLQAFVILEPPREPRMMNIHGFSAPTLWLVLYA